MDHSGRPLRSSASEALSRLVLDTPPGWTLSGITGLVVLVNPSLGFLARLIDYSVLEQNHCYHALMRSIERSTNEASHDRHYHRVQDQS